MEEMNNNVTVEELVPAEETTDVVEVDNSSDTGAVAVGALMATGVIALGYGIYKGIGKLHNMYLNHKEKKAAKKAEAEVELTYEEQVQEIHENIEN